MKKPLALVISLCAALSSTAQDLNGFWKGTLSMGGGCFATNNIELQIHITGTEVFGDSYHYEDVNNYVKKKISGVYDPVTKKIVLHELYVTTHHIPATCFMNFMLPHITFLPLA